MKIKKIIDGKKYNTETGILLASQEYESRGSWKHLHEQLYKSVKGAYFIAYEGGPLSRYGIDIGNRQVSSSKGIYLISEEEGKNLWQNIQMLISMKKNLGIFKKDKGRERIEWKKRDIMVMHEVENDLGVKCEVYTNKDNVKYYSNVRCKIVISNLNEEINDKETLELLEKLGFSVSYLEEELYIENGECMRNSENDSSVITVDDYYILYTSHSIDKVEIYLKIALNVDGYCSYWVSLYEELFNTYKESMRKSDWYLECKRKWDGEVEYNYKGISKNEKYQLLSEKKKEEIKGFFSDHLFDNYVEEYIEFDAELLGADIADDSLKPTDDFYDEDEENLKSIIENIVRSHIEVFIDNVLTDTITGNIYVYI